MKMDSPTTTTAKAKRGRKAKDHKCSWDGHTVNGLYHKPGTSVWRVRSTGQEYTEPDERRAVTRFYEIMARNKPAVAISVAELESRRVRVHDEEVEVADEDLAGHDSALEEIQAAGAQLAASIKQVTDDSGAEQFTLRLDEARMFQWMRDMILDQPKRCARLTGIEWLEYGPTLKRPGPSPKLVELGTLYTQKPKLSDNERSRSKLYWKEFVRVIGVATLDQVDRDAVGRYESWLAEQKLAPKSVRHRISKVRTVFSYAMKRGVNTRAALDACTMLETPTALSLNPDPISPAQFWKIFDAAVAAGDQQFSTMMLTALNLCMYPSEVAVIERSELDFKWKEFTSRRNKTAVPRIGILWTETIQSLKRLPQRESDYVFHSDRVLYNSNLIGKAWREYRAAAGLPDDVVFAGIRDAAFTIACRDTKLDEARMLAGHRAGMADAYVLRAPKFVADACAAIRKEFDVARHVKGRR